MKKIWFHYTYYTYTNKNWEKQTEPNFIEAGPKILFGLEKLYPWLWSIPFPFSASHNIYHVFFFPILQSSIAPRGRTTSLKRVALHEPHQVSLPLILIKILTPLIPSNSTPSSTLPQPASNKLTVFLKVQTLYFVSDQKCSLHLYIAIIGHAHDLFIYIISTYTPLLFMVCALLLFGCYFHWICWNMKGFILLC